MNRLHRIGGRWDEGGAGLKPVTLRPGITGHFHGVPIPLSRSSPLEARFERSRTAVRACRLDRLSGWMEAFGAGLYLRRLLTLRSVKE
ncbi:hypothetical protein GCM10007874_54780 [Labrys miyagiensis]|uniref:Uncharacterized protein n=1 Tax=Labrys miyagiensis TaxID=346912 RepID=A0ABQ6CQQ3_9HYPH|nr:hypothetical protein GCM10007874_54780 [Labrys miyagiensis]